MPLQAFDIGTGFQEMCHGIHVVPSNGHFQGRDSPIVTGVDEGAVNVKTSDASEDGITAQAIVTVGESA